MARIWFEDRIERKPRPLSEPMSDHAAIMLFNSSLRSWSGPHQPVFNYECLLYLDQQDLDSKNPWGVLFIEFLPCDDDTAPEGRTKEERTTKW